MNNTLKIYSILMLILGTAINTLLFYEHQDGELHPNMPFGVGIGIVVLVLSIIFYIKHTWSNRKVGYYIALVIVVQLFCITGVMMIKKPQLWILLLPFGATIAGLSFILKPRLPRFKITQFNWEVWFLSTVVIAIASCILFMCSNQSFNDPVTQVAVGLLLISGISIIPCMYIGCKPRP